MTNEPSAPPRPLIDGPDTSVLRTPPDVQGEGILTSAGRWFMWGFTVISTIIAAVIRLGGLIGDK